MRTLIHHCTILVMAVGFVMLPGCSGGGGGGGASGDGESTSTMTDQQLTDTYTAAMDAFKTGSIHDARDYFTQIIESYGGSGSAASEMKGVGKAAGDVIPTLYQASFGRALANIILLMESTPITDILNGFGQQPWSVDSVFGAGGWLERAEAINGANDVNIAITGQVSEAVDQQFARTKLAYYFDYGTRIVQVRSLIDEVLSIGNSYISFNVYTSFDPGPTNTATGTCSINAGDVITPDMTCSISGAAPPLEFNIVSAQIDGFHFAGTYRTDPATSAGSVTVNQIGSSLGDTISVIFNDLVLKNSNGDSITLNGTFSDTITADMPSGAGLPFSSIQKTAQILSDVKLGYRSSDVIGSLRNGALPLLDAIIADLVVAVSDPVATFDIPKELFIGSDDMHVIHSDMLVFLSMMHFLEAGINFLNSFTADMALDGLYDAGGYFIGNKAALVSELNQFFELRQDHQLVGAQNNLSDTLGYAQQALAEIIGGAVGGMLEVTADNSQFYTELNTLVNEANQAMSSWTAISVLNPSVSVNMDYVFSHPLNGADIPIDPFVLESGEIKPVEAYFSELMQNTCNYDLSVHPNTTVFSAAVRAAQHWIVKIFPGVMKNRVAGWKFDNGV